MEIIILKKIMIKKNMAIEMMIKKSKYTQNMMIFIKQESMIDL